MSHFCRDHYSLVTLFLSESGDELLWCNGSHLLLLGGDGVEEVGQTGEQGLLTPFVLGLVLQHLLAKGLAEVERLKHRVRVAGVAELGRGKEKHG